MKIDTRGRREAFISGMSWANKLGRAKPCWLMYLYPDVIRMTDKDGVKMAWVRNQPGALELVEVEWGPFAGIEGSGDIHTNHKWSEEEWQVGRAKEDAFDYGV